MALGGGIDRTAGIRNKTLLFSFLSRSLFGMKEILAGENKKLFIFKASLPIMKNEGNEAGKYGIKYL